MITAADVPELLNRLDAAGVDWWIDGGWGVDALLGYQTRPHDDLDFAVRLEDVERLPSVFPEFRRDENDEWPSAYVLRDERGRQLDFHPLEFDERGDGWQPQLDGSRTRWPREALQARGRISGREVRCTTPEFQVEAHLYEGHDDLDWAAVTALCERFRLPLPPGGPPGFVHERRPTRAAPMTEGQLMASRVGDARPSGGSIVLVDYDPAWPRQFEREEQRIRGALGDGALAIEHTGSTSVPGLAAKPIIDITLVVEDTRDEAAYVPALEAAGYDLSAREPDWFEHRMLRRDEPSVNLHVFSRGCEEVERMVAFRDRLRANAADRELYERTKRELAQHDWRFAQNYADAKSGVIREILARGAAER